MATPLSQSLQVLSHPRSTQRPVDPTVALLVQLKVSKIERLLLAGIRHHQLVPVDRWQRAVREIQGLTAWLASTR